MYISYKKPLQVFGKRMLRYYNELYILNKILRKTKFKIFYFVGFHDKGEVDIFKIKNPKFTMPYSHDEYSNVMAFEAFSYYFHGNGSYFKN